MFVYDRPTATTRRASVNSRGEQSNSADAGSPARPALSADGRLVAFSSRATNLVERDSKGHYDVFVYDLQTAPRAASASLARDGRATVTASGSASWGRG